ncbi:MAG: hypothetical protein HUK40_10705 [Desulfobacter sp.]|nr:hypothetical protein [Desulfobacter sp.]
MLHGKEKQMECVPLFNTADKYQCAWPSSLEISLDDRGGDFRQTWLINSRTWVALPGNSRHWPMDIRVDSRPKVVLGNNDLPRVMLLPGSHVVTGRFAWNSLPEYIQVPRESGLLSLTINDKKLNFPNLDTRGRLWLRQIHKEKRIEDRLKIECFRLIDDAIPPRVSLDVAGAARQVTIGPVYAPNAFTPISLKSPLPARLEKDATIKIQVRPGKYRLHLDLRHSGPLDELGFTPLEKGVWPSQETWSFKARPDLRLVEIFGVPAIDPLQTSMPKAWQNYPAYLMKANTNLKFKEIKRGDPRPAPDQLSLDRTLWLRFDGSGYFIQDKIKGKKNTNWRLEMDPATSLGQVIVDGKEQLITRQKKSDNAGIELRNGQINLVADSIFKGKISPMPATGWDHDFQRVSGRLHLPPGWTLVHASGMDNIPHTWIKKWTLLDFFMVLIFTIALAKLYSKKLAPIAFITMVLIFHEPNAPRYVWLVMLVGFALLKFLPKGRFKNLIKLFQGAAVLAFVAIVIPYSIQALRIGIYPQLAQPWTSMTEYAQKQINKNRSLPRAMDAVQKMAPAAKAPIKAGRAIKEKGERMLFSSMAEPYDSGQRVMQYDPKALTQTGPGMPLWRPFKTINFSWSGPVTRDQQVSFTLVGPKINRVLSFIRVGLIIVLAMGMFGMEFKPGKGVHIRALKSFAPCLALLIICMVHVPTLAQASEIPSNQMLEELEKRLLEKEDCFPNCADISEISVRINALDLKITGLVQAQTDVAIPVPGHEKQWLPTQVSIDNSPAKGLIRKDNRLWLMIPKGRHRINLQGPIRNQNTFQLTFHLKPRRLDVRAEGWSVEGVHADGRFDGQLQFKQKAKQTAREKEVLETGVLPPFARVERTLLLGLVWKIQTRVTRIGPFGAGMVMDIPLIKGESVTTQGIRVQDNRAKINLRSDQRSLTWESFLEPAGEIRLTHIKPCDWTEVWKVDVSPVFHMAYEGIPVIFHKNANLWYPTWYPWPGESVNLTISRPQGIDGQTLTIEKSLLKLAPGQNTTTAQLFLSLKSSQGGHHAIQLVPGARLQEVKIKGKIQPIRQDGTRVVLPIVPGKQEIELKWMDANGISTRFKSPKIDLGLPSANASVDIRLPRNRWPLLVGGDQLVGPAVLFWSVLIIVFIIALGLSRTQWAGLHFFHWFLLCLGMSMSNLGAGILVIGWLIALDFRKKANQMKGGSFNLVQVGIVLLTFLSAAALVFAISNGLLGHPDMNIRGNGSSAGLLRWYHDVSLPVLPQAWVISIPMLAYRIAMLAWAL